MRCCNFQCTKVIAFFRNYGSKSFNSNFFNSTHLIAMFFNNNDLIAVIFNSNDLIAIF